MHHLPDFTVRLRRLDRILDASLTPKERRDELLALEADQRRAAAQAMTGSARRAHLAVADVLHRQAYVNGE